MDGFGRVLRQTAFVIALHLVTFLILGRILPGFTVGDIGSGLALASAVVLGNIFVRPLILLLTLPLTIVTLGLWSLVLNAIIIFAASLIVPGQMTDGFGTALILAAGFATVNAAANALSLIQDEDTFYYYFANRLSVRTEEHELVGSGLLVVEIDGLAEPVLREALAAGRMPNLRRWLLGGQFEMRSWWCHLPTQTSSSQAGILYGNDRDIPGFRWYDKRSGQLVESSNLEDAAAIAKRLYHSRALLRGGASISNLLDGGAKERFATASATQLAGSVRQPARDLFLFFYDPYSFLRTLVLVLAELAIGLLYEFRRLRRGHAHFKFAITRAITNVLLAELTTFYATRELFDGTPAIYLTYVGYDQVAHYRGPRSRDAMGTLRNLDRQIARLRRVAQSVPREYSLVILSDHGQSVARQFSEVSGAPLEQVVAGSAGSQPIWTAMEDSELMGHFSSLLTGPAESRGAGGMAARSLLDRVHGGREQGDPNKGIGLGPGAQRDGGIIVCPSGNLANVYFTAYPHQLSAAEIAKEFPSLVPSLVNDPGIGFVVTRSQSGGALVSGPGGVLDLATGDVLGRDPLSDYPNELADSIARLAEFSNAGDIIINGATLPDGRVAAFEPQESVHGGAGGEQATPFVIYPSQFEVPDEPLVGADAIYQFLLRHRPPIPSSTAD
jgi:uncharacterized membrane protein YvlD (DUF360 family)